MIVELLTVELGRPAQSRREKSTTVFQLRGVQGKEAKEMNNEVEKGRQGKVMF